MLILFVTAIMTIGFVPTQAIADYAYDQKGSDMSQYQAILDKLNAEYDTDFFFINQEAVDLSHRRMIEAYGYLPEGGPRVTTLEDLQQFTLREYEAYARADCIEVVAQRQAAEMNGFETAPSQQIPSESSNGVSDRNSNSSRAIYYSYDVSPNPFNEYAYAGATKSNNKYNSLSYAVYSPNEGNYVNLGYNYFVWSSYTRTTAFDCNPMTIKFSGSEYRYLSAVSSTRICNFY